MKATAIIMGRKYEAEGNTAYEAIENLEVPIAKGRCILVMDYGDYTKERVLMPAIAHRLFVSKGLTRQVALKNISMLYE